MPPGGYPYAPPFGAEAPSSPRSGSDEASGDEDEEDAAAPNDLLHKVSGLGRFGFA